MSQEMIEGFWEQKLDKFGNIKSFYHPDTRMQVIESVTTLKNTMIADISDSDYETEIESIFETINALWEDYHSKQQEWWKTCSNKFKQYYLSINKNFNPLFFDKNSPFYQEYINDKLSAYRRVFEQLELCLAKDLRYFKRGRVRVNKDGSTEVLT